MGHLQGEICPEGVSHEQSQSQGRSHWSPGASAICVWRRLRTYRSHLRWTGVGIGSRLVAYPGHSSPTRIKGCKDPALLEEGIEPSSEEPAIATSSLPMRGSLSPAYEHRQHLKTWSGGRLAREEFGRQKLRICSYPSNVSSYRIFRLPRFPWLESHPALTPTDQATTRVTSHRYTADERSCSTRQPNRFPIRDITKFEHDLVNSNILSLHLSLT